jgi:hypothetical protein
VVGDHRVVPVGVSDDGHTLPGELPHEPLRVIVGVVEEDRVGLATTIGTDPHVDTIVSNDLACVDEVSVDCRVVTGNVHDYLQVVCFV